MAKLVSLRVVLASVLTCSLLLAAVSAFRPVLPSQAATPGPHGASLLFIENVGQFDRQARFRTWGGGGDLWLADDRLWLSLPGQASTPDTATSPQGVHLKLAFVGANPQPVMEPLGLRPTTVSFFVGNDPAAWRAAVPVWSGVRYRDLYPGLDLVVAGPDGDWRWRWEVSGADGLAALATARLRVEGADSLTLDGGTLHLTTALGPTTLVLPAAVGAPAVLPALEGTDIVAPVGLAWTSEATLTAADVGDLAYSTFLGGDSYDSVRGVQVDSSGNAYIAGTAGFTAGTAFPTTSGAYDQSNNGASDVVVAKLNPTGSALVYATFIGGTGGEEAHGLAIDSSGAVVVTGVTNSSNFPTTTGAYDTTYNGGNFDAFVTKLNPSGAALNFSTFLGGNRADVGYAVTFGSSGTVYVAGLTNSATFPTTSGAYDESHNGDEDGFVTKFSATLNALQYSTFLGGTDADYAYALTVDSSGAAYLTGVTRSSTFPTSNAYDSTFNGNDDVFVAKLNPAGSALPFSTFMGGDNNDQALGLAVRDGYAYVAGSTHSTSFPTTSGAFDQSYNGAIDAFLTKLQVSEPRPTPTPTK